MPEMMDVSVFLFGSQSAAERVLLTREVASMHHKEGCEARGEQDAAWKWRSWEAQCCPHIERPGFQFKCLFLTTFLKKSL